MVTSCSQKCPRCGYPASDPRQVRCPRCRTLLIGTCQGHCQGCFLKGRQAKKKAT
ncbi:hypothetical protein MGLY_29680 [Neomoorella glycerini]|uniref:Uncharacterized protein n=1 Tax=Neomoorella glycerini TaxID=55779 RepID=A0A6I5ZU29_9FIRM|nr:hypothetical protein [Moorella glycerini]QGP93552.1 hypothetical protein MGLY_29680 [Moorella glycerini]